MACMVYMSLIGNTGSPLYWQQKNKLNTMSLRHKGQSSMVDIHQGQDTRGDQVSRRGQHLLYYPKLKQDFPYLTLRSPDLGEISFLNALPICAAANGSLPLLKSNNRLKLTKIPCAVSGRRKLENEWN